MVFDKFRQQLSQLGDLKRMRDQALAIQRQLAAEEVVVEEQGVKVVISGDQKIKELSVQGISNQILVDVLNKAIRRSQEIAAKKLQEMSGGLSGLLGK
ncbi:MAG: YbaB/EbfC family nucleoid-associated protein [Microgenomates group bacterium]